MQASSTGMISEKPADGICQLLQTRKTPTIYSVRVKFEMTGELTLCAPTKDPVVKDVKLILCHESISIESLKRSLIFQDECGINHDQFLARRESISYQLGRPIIYPNSTAYFQSRCLWKNMHRRGSLTSWGSTFGGVNHAVVKRRLSFASIIDVALIPPKEGVDFDIDDESAKTYTGYELLNTPLMPEEDYVECWAPSPFVSDNGGERPFYHNKNKIGPSGWCLCKKVPNRVHGRKISCQKCLNLELRKFVRKCTPEEFQEHYLKTVTD